ncbi:LysM peptidoglycan-binding domain-containing protein [Thalassotalea agariperforans]
MFKKLLIIILSALLPMLSVADVLTIKKDAPTSYVVKKGDTLWDISGIFLSQPWLWPKLWRLNPEINNPHLIYPGDELRLVFDEKGEPMLVRGKPELKWSPKVRTTLKDQNPVATIPLSVISPFLKYDFILTEAQIDNAPYVLGSDEGQKSSIEGFKLYINDDLVVNKAYGIYHQGEEIIDPETGESLGFHAILVGSGKVIREGNMADKVPSTLYVDNAKQEIRSGAIVLPVNEGQLYPSYFTMQAVNSDVEGQIISSASDVREFGKLEVVLINKGNKHSVNPGDILTIKRTSPGVLETNDGPVYTADASRWSRLASADNSDYKMPAENLGTSMVFKVYDEVSLALILKSSKPIRLNDIVSAP